MRKRKRFSATLMGVVVVGLSAYVGYRTYDAYNGVSEGDLLLENAEALASSGENPEDCNYKNGYTSFTNKKGGAYDCCLVWVPRLPNDEHCR